MTVQPPTPFPLSERLHEQVSFDRHELSAILTLYGRMVAMGEWRDYGISNLRDLAVFAVFRRTAETPLYRIEKRPSCAASRGCMRSWGLTVRSCVAGTNCPPC